MKYIDLQKEKELLGLAQEDSKAFDQLYTYFVNDVYRFSYSILNSQHDAEDITSQTFIEFYKKIREFEWQDVSIKYWLFRTARNLSYKKFRIQPETSLDETIEVEDYDSISFVDEIMNKDLIEKVKEEIVKLSSIEQQIINLRIWEGMSYKEIADITASTEEAARKRFTRTIARIKEALKERNIKALASLPVLFTGIFLVGTNTAYAAPSSLTGSTSFSSLLINKQTTMTGIQTLLKNKVALSAIAGVAVLTVAGITATYMYSNRTTSSTDNNSIAQVTPTITQEPTPTIEPTVTLEPTATVLPTPLQVTPTPSPVVDPYAGWETYRSNEFGITFRYPSKYVKIQTYPTPGKVETISLDIKSTSSANDLSAVIELKDIRNTNIQSEEYKMWTGESFGSPSNEISQKTLLIEKVQYPTKQYRFGDGGERPANCPVDPFSGNVWIYSNIRSKIGIRVVKQFDKYCSDDKGTLVDKKTSDQNFNLAVKIAESLTITR